MALVRCPSPLVTGNTLPRTHQLRRYGATLVHVFMRRNKNITAELVERLHKLAPEAFNTTDE